MLLTPQIRKDIYDIQKEKQQFEQYSNAVNVIRTIRAMINTNWSDENFRKHIISLMHSISIGCIGQNVDVPEELIKYELPKEWK